MYSYKINNSNTIYVCTEYINECMKNSKRKKSSSIYAGPKVTTYYKHVIPPALDTCVSHKRWGIGRLVEANTKGIMTIAFADRLVKFVYPDAFSKGFLVRV